MQREGVLNLWVLLGSAHYAVVQASPGMEVEEAAMKDSFPIAGMLQFQ